MSEQSASEIQHSDVAIDRDTNRIIASSQECMSLDRSVCSFHWPSCRNIVMVLIPTCWPQGWTIWRFLAVNEWSTRIRAVLRLFARFHSSGRTRNIQHHWLCGRVGNERLASLLFVRCGLPAIATIGEFYPVNVGGAKEAQPIWHRIQRTACCTRRYFQTQGAGSHSTQDTRHKTQDSRLSLTRHAQC